MNILLFFFEFCDVSFGKILEKIIPLNFLLGTYPCFKLQIGGYLIQHNNQLERIKVRVRVRLLKDDYGERRL